MGSIIEGDDVRLAGGLSGRLLNIATANPKNFHHAISKTPAMPELEMMGASSFPKARVPSRS